MTIPTLIDKLDTFEIVRDQIAGILRTEFISQQALAVTAGKDPLLWAPDIFLERDFPIDKWINEDGTLNANTVPNVTISIENSQRNDRRTSVPTGKQVYEVTYLIDCLARGVDTETATGHIPADKDAHFNCQATVRLVRNILSATIYRKLELVGLIDAHPHFSTFEYGQPPVEAILPHMSVWNGRGRFMVTMVEFAPEFVGENLELIHIDISDHGGVILSTEIDTTV